jgi:hypothetical protein
VDRENGVAAGDPHTSDSAKGKTQDRQPVPQAPRGSGWSPMRS